MAFGRIYGRLLKRGDPLYVLLPEGDEYQPLTKELYQEILEGKHRF